MIAPIENAYAGGELDLFRLAVNWKRYVKAEIAPYLRGDVLEVGAGIGGTTRVFHDGSARSWVCLEPDPYQARRLQDVAAATWGEASPRVVVGSLRSFKQKTCFDCVLYIDVLEHIKNDRSEIEAASRLIRTGGCLVVLSPAHQWLFSEFDRQVGHFRRYTKSELEALTPPGYTMEKSKYLDSLGTILSLGNVLLLRKAMPARWQIALWDSVCVPCSRGIDRVLGGRVGRSVLVVWHKNNPAT